MFAFNDASSDVPLKTPVKLPEFLPYAIPLVEPVVFGQVPNIQGYFQATHTLKLFESFSGAFVANGDQGKDFQFSSTGGNDPFGLLFDASIASATYGWTTVQPAALQALPCIRC